MNRSLLFFFVLTTIFLSTNCVSTDLPNKPDHDTRAKISSDSNEQTEAEGKTIQPTCKDNIQNQDETDIDCGGSNCPPCEPGKKCESGVDCESLNCSNSKICKKPRCVDGYPNGDETDADCGGSKCDPCDYHKKCNEDSDCKSRVCKDYICRKPTCNDDTHNGKESGVDCGSEKCGKCTSGKKCSDNEDCLSKVCNNENRCKKHTCKDGVKNGNETDTDCGGSCKGCSPDQKCSVDGDCASSICKNGKCIAPTCSDGVLNGNETKTDCGGHCAAKVKSPVELKQKEEGDTVTVSYDGSKCVQVKMECSPNGKIQIRATHASGSDSAIYVKNSKKGKEKINFFKWNTKEAAKPGQIFQICWVYGHAGTNIDWVEHTTP